MKTQKLQILLCLFLLLNGFVFSQKTAVYNQPDFSYQSAIELFNKQKYNSAKEMFQSVGSSIQDAKSEMKASCLFYAALCACELYNNDAPALLTEFINLFPENAHLNQTYFALGKYYFFKQKYDLSLKNFNLVNSIDLNESEKAEYYFKKAYSAFVLNDFAAAKINFSEVKDKDNKYSSPATYYYSHILYKEKKFEAALKGFEKLKKDETFGAIVPYYIAQIYYLQGKYNELIEIATALLNSSSPKRTAEISRFIFEANFNLGKYSEAIPYMLAYKDKTTYSFSREDNYQLGYCYYKTNDYAKAIPCFVNTSATADSLGQNAMFYLGDSYVKTKKKKDAYQTFGAAYKLDFDPKIKEESLYNFAKLSFDLSYNPYNEAIKAFEKYLLEYPESKKKDEMYGFLVDIYTTTRNYKDAIASIENISKLNPKLLSTYQKLLYFRGVEQFNDEKYAEAIGLFDKDIANNFDPQYTALGLYWKADAYDRQDNYDSAQINYALFYTIPEVSRLPEYKISYYNMGYSQFKKKSYAQALISFKKYIEVADNKDKKIFNDATLRLADCYFVTKNYSAAIEYYDNVIEAKVGDMDYALYQKAISLGVLGKLEGKAQQLTKLLEQYPKSTYADDATFELGNTYSLLKNDTKALEYFNLIASKHSNSYYNKIALLKTGLIQYNNHQDEQALVTFKKVTELYPGSSESKEALVNIKNIYVDQNKVDDFFIYVKGLSFANVTESEQDSITYIAAENRYMSNDCESAVKSFATYIEKFAKGAFALQANYYKSECEMRSGKTEDAIKGYEYVIAQPQSKFTESSLQKAANINYALKNYKKSFDQFTQLEENAEYKANLIESGTGKMRCAYLLKNYPQAIQSSRSVLLLDKITLELKSEAHLTIAKSALAIDSLALAQTEFEITAKLAHNEAAAESKYNLALIYYNQGNLDKSEKIIFDFISQSPSYEELLAKNFILLSDIYVKKDNLFQAKQTLQSIIDNYEGADIVKIAHDKLNAILESEKAKEAKQNELNNPFGKEE
ncbi:MAG: tetratricopeptide repeat protein [Bacteroidota bacterium]